MLANVRTLGHVGTGDHNAFFCSALATLNINRDSMARYGFSPPTRIFEAAGASACLITDAWDGLDRFLEPEREILSAQDGEDVAAILERLDPDRARSIGAAAKRRVLAEHTYSHRAGQVAELLGASARGREAAE
jgi:spore maturation protein CgeB